MWVRVIVITRGGNQCWGVICWGVIVWVRVIVITRGVTNVGA